MESSSILPDDLLEEILSRLSVKQLLRLRCVSKSWSAVIDNDYSFMKKQYQFQYDMSKADDDVPLFTECDSVPSDGPTRFHILSKQRGEDVLLNLTPDIHRDIDTISCVGVVNGIILLQWWYDPRVVDKHMGLWNPGTREFKVVPVFNQTCQHIFGLGIGIDPLLSNDFKIVAYFPTMTLNNTGTICDVYGMYSLRTNSWKRVEGLRPPYV